MTESLQQRITSPARLGALRATGLLDAPSVPELDRYVRIAKLGLDAPVALVSLVDADRQFFSSADGLPDEVAHARETPLSHSFCQHVVRDGQSLIVEDAPNDARVCDNGAVRDLAVAAYAGMPITSADGHVLGSFCVIDMRPRKWTERELSLLHELSQCVSEEIELRRRAAAAEDAESSLREVNEALFSALQGLQLGTRAAAHDLRTPLSVLSLGLTHLTEHGAMAQWPELARMVEMLNRNLEHAVSLTGSLYAGARHEENESRARAASEGAEDIPALVSQICADLGRAWPGDLRVDASISGEASIGLTATQLRRCVENLVGNGLRFANQVLKLTLRREGDELALCVEDDGPGLPSPETAVEVWKPNVRLHADDGRSKTGLGLFIVRELVQHAGGRVHAGPSPLGGAAFTLRLPLVRSTTA